MANRRRRQISLPCISQTERHASNNMDQLAFKYMEMCKMESSTDSDSEISPRWSDTSTMGCASSAPESGTFHRTLPLTCKPAGRHCCYSLFLDPYDGSSEDSDESNVVSGRRTRQQARGGGCRFLGRSRRFILHHPASVALREVAKKETQDTVTEQQHVSDDQMKCGVEPDPWVCELDILPSHSDRGGCRALTREMTPDLTMPTQTMDIEFRCQCDDSGVHATTSSTPQTPGPVVPVEGSLSKMPESSSERSSSSSNFRSLYKRKLGFHGADVVLQGQRKRPCVVNMETELEGADP